MAFNPLYLLLLIPMLLAWLAQAKVREVYEKFGAQPNQTGDTGVENARRLLAHAGLAGVQIERTPGYLTDHYDPQAKVLRLSDGVANGKSVTALGIVAHEVGHAAQDAEDYHFMRLRSFLARRVGEVTRWSSVAFIGGWVIDIPILMALSGLIMAAMLVFSLATLPVERNASDRAIRALEQTGLAAREEHDGVRQVLRAAAFTYLAGVVQRLGSFLFFALMIAAANGVFQLPA